MKIFILYPSPIEMANALTPTNLALQIKAYQEEMKRVEDMGYREWLDRCQICFAQLLRGAEPNARWWSSHADAIRPKFITEEFCEEQRAKFAERVPKKKRSKINDNRDVTAEE